MALGLCHLVMASEMIVSCIAFWLGVGINQFDSLEDSTMYAQALYAPLLIL